MINFKLYKYMKLRPEFFENRWLRASSNHSLNDPFENRLSDEYLIDLILSLSVFKADSKNDAVRILESQRDMVDNAVYALFSNHGVTSFTETRDNLLMWSHYADEHKGMVVEFDPNHEFFISTYTTPNNSHEGHLSRVLYRKERLSQVDDYLMDVFVHKSDEWSYEKEHRLILNLSSAHKKLIAKKEKKFIEEFFSDEKTLLKERGHFWELPEHSSLSYHSGFLSQKKV